VSEISKCGERMTAWRCVSVIQMTRRREIFRNPSVTAILADPTVRDLMFADKVGVGELRLMLDNIADLLTRREERKAQRFAIAAYAAIISRCHRAIGIFETQPSRWRTLNVAIRHRAGPEATDWTGDLFHG
jgi:hypothetical protein